MYCYMLLLNIYCFLALVNIVQRWHKNYLHSYINDSALVAFSICTNESERGD